MDKTIEFRVPGGLKAAALKYANEQGTTLSALLRKFLESLPVK